MLASLSEWKWHHITVPQRPLFAKWSKVTIVQRSQNLVGFLLLSRSLSDHIFPESNPLIWSGNHLICCKSCPIWKKKSLTLLQKFAEIIRSYLTHRRMANIRLLHCYVISCEDIYFYSLHHWLLRKYTPISAIWIYCTKISTFADYNSALKQCFQQWFPVYTSELPMFRMCHNKVQSVPYMMRHSF